MKKIVLTALVAVCALTANAQAWFGGSVGFNMYDNDGKNNETETNFEIRPEIGYSLNENWDIAVGLGFSSWTNLLGIKDNNTTEFTISPYARYTFAKSGIASFFVDGGISYGSYKEKHADAQSTFEIAIRPGIKVALSDKVALVSHIGSFGYKSIEDEYDKFGLNVDNSAIDFGMYFSF